MSSSLALFISLLPGSWEQALCAAKLQPLPMSSSLPLFVSLLPGSSEHLCYRQLASSNLASSLKYTHMSLHILHYFLMRPNAQKHSCMRCCVCIHTHVHIHVRRPCCAQPLLRVLEEVKSAPHTCMYTPKHMHAREPCCAWRQLHSGEHARMHTHTCAHTRTRARRPCCSRRQSFALESR